jgi:hypothetical protein
MEARDVISRPLLASVRLETLMGEFSETKRRLLRVRHHIVAPIWKMSTRHRRVWIRV